MAALGSSARPARPPARSAPRSAPGSASCSSTRRWRCSFTSSSRSRTGGSSGRPSVSSSPRRTPTSCCSRRSGWRRAATRRRGTAWRGCCDRSRSARLARGAAGGDRDRDRRRALAWLLWRRWYWATRHTRRTLALVLLTGGASLVLLLGAAVADRSSAAGGRALGWAASSRSAPSRSRSLPGILRSRLARASVAELVRELQTARTPGALREALRRALGDPDAAACVLGLGDARLRRPPRAARSSCRGRAAARWRRWSSGTEALRRGARARRVAARRAGAAGGGDLGGRPGTRERAAPCRAARARRRPARVARPHRRGRRLRAAAAGAQPPRRRAAAARGDVAAPASRWSRSFASDPEGAALLVAQVREELARGARGAARARARDPSGDPERPRARARRCEARRRPQRRARCSCRRRPSGCRRPVEAAIYYVVSEALANVAKYAQASSVTVEVAGTDGRAVVAVADDGVGGADPTAAPGLRGLADRVAALDGRLHVDSAPSRGTRIHADIPCALERRDRTATGGGDGEGLRAPPGRGGRRRPALAGGAAAPRRRRRAFRVDACSSSRRPCGGDDGDGSAAAGGRHAAAARSCSARPSRAASPIRGSRSTPEASSPASSPASTSSVPGRGTCFGPLSPRRGGPARRRRSGRSTSAAAFASTTARPSRRTTSSRRSR